MGRLKGHDAQASIPNKEQALVALATVKTTTDGRKHTLIIGRMSLKTPISKSIIADMTVVHNTGIKAGEMGVEIKAEEIEIDPIMKKDSMKPSLEILTTGVGAS